MNSIDVARTAVAAALDKKAMRPVLMDLRGISDLCDFQFVCSGDNNRQTKAIAEAIESACKQKGSVRPVAIEGKQAGNWIMIDYGPTIVHIFFDYLRDYYALEQLWPKAKHLDWK
jgi:ribosome-associated protein